MFKYLLKMSAIAAVIVGINALVAPASEAAACGGGTGFFGLPPWHEYLPCDGDSVSSDLALDDLWLIAVAVLETILRLSGLLGVGFVIFGGFKYMTSQGSPEGTKSARSTIIYALVGVTVTVFASVAVSLAMRVVTGGNIGTNNDLGIPSATTDGAIANVLKFVYALSAVVAMLYIAIGGFKYTTSTGDPQKAAGARNTIIYAIVGLIVVLCAYLITGAIISRI